MAQEIEIKWKAEGFLPNARAPLSWFETTSGIGNERLEDDLAWPRGTFATLYQAFEKKTSRFTPWDLQKVANKEPFFKASEVYKRGVPTIPPRAVAKAQSGHYRVHFFAAVKALMARVTADADAFVVLDREVALRWQLASPSFFVTHLTEATKTLNSVAALTKVWKKQRQKKHWYIIGGGVLADTAAFAAAMAGSTFTLVPTTLLAMADACVGGKTGVNFPPFGKNQVGLFAYPREVLVAPEWLTTLPTRELKAGLAECLKHAFLKGDKGLVQGAWDTMLPAVIKVKADVVEEDPFEHGVRTTLNFGHTFGHAIESHSQALDPQNHLLHGEAVALGMIYAGILSHKVAGLPQEDLEFIISALRNAGCVPTMPSLKEAGTFEAVFAYMSHDKKADATSQWVLLSKLGQPFIKDGKYTTAVERPVLERAWQEFLRLL